MDSGILDKASDSSERPSMSMLTTVSGISFNVVAVDDPNTDFSDGETVSAITQES